MIKRSRIGIVLVAGTVLAALSGWDASSQACTNLMLKPQDGSVLYGRTMEFVTDVGSVILVAPRNKEYIGTSLNGKPGMKWTARYGLVGTSAGPLPHVLEGLNEKGLAVGLFYFPGFATYMSVPADGDAKAIAAWELGTYLLGTCATVEEAKAALDGLIVCPAAQPDGSPAPPSHWMVRDASGRCLIIEPTNGQLKTYDAPLGVVTNSPDYDWHMINLSNYSNQSALSVAPRMVSGVKIGPLSQGSGMLGLPGDFTSPSRFVRAVAFSQTALPAANAQEGVLRVFHLMNLFDIPLGAARSQNGTTVTADYTQYTIVGDLTNRKMYFHTFDSRGIRLVDLNKCDFDAKEFRCVPMDQKEVIQDLTAQQKAFPPATQPTSQPVK